MTKEFWKIYFADKAWYITNILILVILLFALAVGQEKMPWDFFIIYILINPFVYYFGDYHKDQPKE